MIIDTAATSAFFIPLIPAFAALVAIYEAARWTGRALGRWRGRRAA